ncbi:hypothetical protein F4559_000642 [Saccharothrix violaceirubra]|uniref:Acyltransferase 3 domain-containing protein n=1 Tax=Saccharothrix violaceirubra TaxID=413306 RepID=A0A7W7SYG4_9PSEU|nr:hypothetical protein [Saccharothrix violaceirubra]
MTRDPFVDAVRAVGIVGVVVGHWLVTSVVATGDGFVVDSPLRWMPWLAPFTWLFQTLGLLFFAGGFAAARSRRSRLRRLVVPVGVLTGTWALVLLGMAARGVPQQTVLTVGYLVVTPLWFLAVYVVFSLVTPLSRWWWVLPVAAVGLAFEWTAVLAVWVVPWWIGVLVARHGQRRRWGSALFVSGGLAFAVCLCLGYPVSAVGVPGAAVSNLFPPTPAALALAVAQIGLVLLIRPTFRARWLTARALPVFLTHQSALLVVTLVGSAFGVLPGLHDLPDDPLWLVSRVLWLPLVAGALFVGNRGQQRRGHRDDVQRDHRRRGAQDEQRGHARQRGQQPGPAPVARAGLGGVQQVPAQQQVDQVLQRVDVQHDQGRGGAGEPGDDETQHAQHSVPDAERGREPRPVGFPGVAGGRQEPALEPVEGQQQRHEHEHQHGRPAR